MQVNMIFIFTRKDLIRIEENYSVNLHSTSNTKVALDGMVGGAPLEP